MPKQTYTPAEMIHLRQVSPIVVKMLIHELVQRKMYDLIDLPVSQTHVVCDVTKIYK